MATPQRRVISRVDGTRSPGAKSIAAYVTAIGGHLRLVADFGQATTTFIDYTDTLTA